jgi:hypothetical protein
VSWPSIVDRASSTSLRALRVAGTQTGYVLTVSTRFSNAIVASGFVPVVVLVASAVSAATLVNVV